MDTSYRLIEVLGLLPVLHVKPGRFRVAVAGPYAELLAAEVRRWPDTALIVMLHEPSSLNDKRIKVVKDLRPGTIDLVLLSPEQDPTPWFPALARNGIIQAVCHDANRWPHLIRQMKGQFGHAVPWREHLPAPIYGVLGRSGASPPTREREPPKTTKRLTSSYLPCLFTFGRDEVTLALHGAEGKIAI